MLSIGISFAVWNYNFLGEANKIETGEISLELLESNTDIISVENALPISDTEGKDQSETFNFAVTTKASMNLSMPYELVIEKLDIAEGYTALSDDEVKVYLEDYEGNTLVEPVKISELADYVLYTDTNVHSKTVTKLIDKYKLRVWIDSEVEASKFYDESADSVKPYQYKFKIGVKTKEAKYQVRYNGNGGYLTQNLSMTSTGDYPWEETDGVYRSGNYNISSSTSVITSEEFTLTETGMLSFDWAVSSQSASYDYLYYTIYKDGTVLSGTGTSTKIGGSYSVTDEANLSYATVEKELESGTYTIEFTYKKNSSTNKGLDRGYVRNIKIPNYNDTYTSDHSIGAFSTLSKNVYKRNHYNFLGWSTTKDGEVLYQDKAKIDDSSIVEGEVVDLYAIWEIEKFNVNLVVQNGTVEGETTKLVDYNNTTTFNVSANDEPTIPFISCTNGQSITLADGVLTTGNITSDTTCTIEFATEATTLYTDGTLIINELASDRSSNITEHGMVTNQYQAMSDSNAYVFEYLNSQPWNSEKSSVTTMEIGSNIQPVSTKFWARGLTEMTTGDFTKLDTSQVTNMRSMFEDAGYNATTFNLEGLLDWDVSSVTSMDGMFYYAGYNATTFNLEGLSNWDVSSVTSMNRMFYRAGGNSTTFELDLLNWKASSVTDMSYMFEDAGYNAITFNLEGLSNWKISSVTDMSYMFSSAGYNATTFDIGDLSSWDTSSVTNMDGMFYDAGYSAETFELDLSQWDTSSVTYMRDMFNSAGYNATTWSIGDLSQWDTSSVGGMDSMFYEAGYSAEIFNIGDLSGWDTSQVTDMSSMFSSAGYNATTFDIGDLSNWDISSVTSTGSMFSSAGYNATTFDIGDLSNWDTSSVRNMNSMFRYAGYNATTFDISYIQNWDTSSVTDMYQMFQEAGYKATTFDIGDLSNWDTSSVIDMRFMFDSAGYNATWSLDCSSWNVNNVTKYTNFNTGAKDKVTAPTWVN